MPRFGEMYKAWPSDFRTWPRWQLAFGPSIDRDRGSLLVGTGELLIGSMAQGSLYVVLAAMAALGLYWMDHRQGWPGLLDDEPSDPSPSF